MPVKNTNAEHAAPKRRLRPSIKIAVAVVVAVLLGWMGLRLHHGDRAGEPLERCG